MRRSSSKVRSSVNLSKERKDLLSQLLIEDMDTIVEHGVQKWLLERLGMIADLLLHKEVNNLVGTRHARNPERDCYRWGAEDGAVYLLEQKVPIRKPRVRTKGAGSSEIELRMYSELNDKEFLNEQAAAKLLGGLSTRRFKEHLEQLLDGRGVGRQTISNRAMEEMTVRLEEFQTRSLVDVDILVVFIDGITLGDTIYIAAVGIDTHGKKHVLGFEDGSTESHGICRNLLSNLIDRGILSAEGGFLCVIDGGKGLKKALAELYGNRIRIQRCTVHKKRNVLQKLQKCYHDEFSHKFNAAYNEPTFKESEKKFRELRDWLATKKIRAADSLTEGLQELLTLHKLGITGTLRRSLSTTNSIESVFSSARFCMRNVKRWRKEEQMERWLASGLLEAEKRLRKVPGYTQLKKLKDILRNPQKQPQISK